jgi:hypothetical protein
MIGEKTQCKRFLVSDQILNPSFWDEYDFLWSNSNERSPFQSPAILKFFSSCFPGNVVGIKLVVDDRLIAAVILRNKNGTYSFLSDLKTDANFFVFHKDCTEDDFKFFFSGFLDIIKKEKWAVQLNNVASWADYMAVLLQCSAKSNLFFQSMDYSVCPVIKKDNPEEIKDLLYRSERVRVKANRLKGKLKAEFEVLTGNDELENWVQEYCNVHILRWRNTSTPSKFRDHDQRLFLLKCLEIWSKEKILVRYAAKVNDERIGFIIGLISGNSVISHALTFHPEHHKASPALALLLNVADFMIEKRLNILDFGYGNEQYKYFFANEELVLKRIFISGKANFSFIAKSKLIRLIKNNPRVYIFFRKNIKKYLYRNNDAKVKTGHT